MTREEREKREHRERLRATFDQAAGLYGRARPGYPPALFDDLADLTGIRPGSRVLEIGPGTDQATLPLAARGGGRCPQLQRGARPVRPVRSRDVPGTGRLGLGCRR